ncbi:MAG: hypothetical protein J2P24_05690 [Streptosporangiales bacterium]|nr:hypothetical protein [Streptosporangiales bacterium]MBO0891425.1 hypothetical protein [Acidothermales bacterium]
MIQKFRCDGVPNMVAAPGLVEARPTLAPRPCVTEAGPLTGKRVILISVDEVTGRSEYLRDHRAISEVLVDDSGKRVVRVVDEAASYPGAEPVRTDPEPGTLWPAELVWLE